MAKNPLRPEPIPDAEMRRIDREAFALVVAGWGLQDAYVHVFNLRDFRRPKPAEDPAPLLPFEGGK